MARTWQQVARGKAHQVKLFGIDICSELWPETGKRAEIIHPLTGQQMTVPVYRIMIADILQNFAAIDLGGGEYAFFL